MELAILIDLGNICAAQSNTNDKEIIINVDKIIRKKALSLITQKKQSTIYNNSIILLTNYIYIYYI